VFPSSAFPRRPPSAFANRSLWKPRAEPAKYILFLHLLWNILHFVSVSYVCTTVLCHDGDVWRTLPSPLFTLGNPANVGKLNGLRSAHIILSS
jgi:hypothetical protein